MGGVLSQWVTPDDLLIAQVRNALAGVNLAVEARIWNPIEGVHEFRFPLVPTSDRSLNTFNTNLHEGYLVSAVIKATAGSPHRGQTLASMLLARPPAATFEPKMLLAQDYVTGSYGPLWPGGRQNLGVEGPGFLYSIALSNPAAGADWTQTVPTGARWRIRDITATLATSAAAGNRTPMLIWDDGANAFAQIGPSATEAPSSTTRWDWIQTLPSLGNVVQGIQVFLPPDLILLAGWRLRTSTVNLGVADQWSGIRFLVEEWLED